MMLIALDQVQGCFRSPGSCRIIWKISWLIIVPGFQNRNDVVKLEKVRCLVLGDPKFSGFWSVEHVLPSDVP
jgi:hypothetical protein